jgi:alkylhydroperoxidase family enzyme
MKTIVVLAIFLLASMMPQAQTQTIQDTLTTEKQIMKKTEISQGPWTRIRPLQRDELDPYTHAAMVEGELTWGGVRNNLCKVMAYLPRMCQTEVEYCNTFIFDPETFRGDVQEAGFNDRFIKELVITRTSLYNRSRYSITHHSGIGMILYTEAGRAEEAHVKYLHLHEHDLHPEIYTERESVILDYTVKVCEDAHLVTDEDFENLRRVLREHNMYDERLKKFSVDRMKRHVDSQIVELTWLIGHFCLLNRWFTVLQVPDETAEDEDDFLGAYEQIVPEDIRIRNEEILKGDF